MTKHFVEKKEDYLPFIYFLRDSVIKINTDHFLSNLRDVGDDGLAAVYVDRTPLQQMIIEWSSIESFYYHMADHKDLTDECLWIIRDMQLKLYDIVYQACALLPIPYVNIFDNISAPLTGKKNFKEYCVPLYNRLSDMLCEMEIPVTVHMDGDLKAISDDIKAARIGGIDSFSPAPDNDTTLKEALESWPGKRILINFPSSVHMLESEKIYSNCIEILKACRRAGRAWIQISENVPPGVWKRSLSEIIKSIDEFV